MHRITAIILFLCSMVGVCQAYSPTRTLPVVYIITDNHAGINDTETQVPCGVYIDSVLPQYHSLGTSAMPLRATIKGRGNWTWNGFDKKPYKIKFDTKQKVLGMPNNRHWCLLAYADDYLGFLKGPAGFAVSRALGLRWTPRQVPVELVINGTYQGLYFLTEHVRIASHRVHIHEQQDGETHRDSISGGWLVEIDNYSSENNITFTEGNGQYVMVSLCEPEVLSSQQRNYLTGQLSALNDALYASTSASLEQMLDLTEAAKFYIVQEVMEDCESYHGSCFLYKDRDSLGVADKWKFGPVWDFGNAFDRHQEKWIYENPTWAQYWVGQLASWQPFQDQVSEQWYTFCHGLQDSVRAELTALAGRITTAAQNDANVWNGSRGYCNNSDMTSRLNDLLWRYNWRLNWLSSQWGEGTQPLTHAVEPAQTDTETPPARKILHRGQVLVLRNSKTYTLTGAELRCP